MDEIAHRWADWKKQLKSSSAPLQNSRAIRLAYQAYDRWIAEILSVVLLSSNDRLAGQL